MSSCSSVPTGDLWQIPHAAINPGSLAVVGASRQVGKAGRVVIDNLIGAGFGGPIWAVNPAGHDLPGVTTIRSLEDLPSPVDHAAICLPARKVPEAMGACGRAGIRYATVFSSGFAEAGTDEGRGLQQALDAAAAEHGIRYIGPNAAGWLNAETRCACTISRTVTRPEPSTSRPVGVVTTSGGVGFVNIMWRCLRAGLRVKYVVTCGNEADLRATDFVGAMIEDPDISAVMLITEHTPDGAELRTLGRRATELGTPIITTPVGRTKAGQESVLSHTGALASDGRILADALHQFGYVVADDVEDFASLAMPHASAAVPERRDVGALCVSGGNIALLADGMESHGFAFPRLSHETTAQLVEQLPAFGAARNPLDLTAAGSAEDGKDFQRALELLSGDPDVALVVPVLTHAPVAMITVVQDHADSSPKPTAALWTGGAIDSDLAPPDLVRGGVACFSSIGDLCRSMGAAVRFRATRTDLAVLRGAASGELRRQGEGLIAQHRDGPQLWAELLRLYDIPTTREALISSEDAALRAAESIGYPVAVKATSTAIPHKGVVGGLRLGVDGPSALAVAYRELETVLGRHLTPSGRVAPAAGGILVQEMIYGGLELALGIEQDRNLGPAVMLGLGGSLLEVIGDVIFLSAPFTAEEARDALSRLRCGTALLEREAAGALDVSALIDCAVRLGAMASDLRGNLVELDINPVVVGAAGDGVKVVDVWARVVDDAQQRPHTAEQGSR